MNVNETNAQEMNAKEMNAKEMNAKEMNAKEMNVKEMSVNDISGEVVDAAMKVHSVLGPGLLESAYQACLAYELRKRGFSVACQVALPIVYEGVHIEEGYRIDMIVENSVVVELKAVSKLVPVNEAQVLSHVKLSGHRVGLLINFHVLHLKDGIKRFVNGL
jgi:GxxExxY protein